MKISATVLLSTILAITSITAMAIPTFNVNVTNFPLDEEGNLRVTEMNGNQAEPSWKVINIVENYNLAWNPSLDPKWIYSEKIDLGSVPINGYSRMKVYMRVTNFTELYQGEPNQAFVTCYLTSIYGYGEIDRKWVNVYWTSETTAQRLFNEFPQPDVWGQEIMRETVEPSIRIRLQGSSYTPNGPVLPSISCLVSIGIYLRNE